MKSSRTNFFEYKSYVCNSLELVIKKPTFLFAAAILLMFLSGCQSQQGDLVVVNREQDDAISETLEQTEPSKTTKEEQSCFEARCTEILDTYQDLYLSAEKEPSEYIPTDLVLTQGSVNGIEECLAADGYPVINTDSKYPAYLENSDDFHCFWEAVSNSDTCEQEIIYVSDYGGIYYYLFKNQSDGSFLIQVNAEWNDNNEPEIKSAYKIRIADWDLSDKDNFFYMRDERQSSATDNYTLVRLNPVDKELYDLNIKYVDSVGYHSNNLFLCDWDSSNYGYMSFNDLLEYFYKMQTDNFLSAKDFPSSHNSHYSYIPAQLFESTILPYFDISLENFRARALYDSESDTYPWQEVCCDNLIYYPLVVPEVAAQKMNDDGTFTLVIDAICGEYKTDKLFTHEVTIRPDTDGGFQYISNKIIYQNSEYDMPPNFPRLKEQR